MQLVRQGRRQCGYSTRGRVVVFLVALMVLRTHTLAVTATVDSAAAAALSAAAAAAAATTTGNSSSSSRSGSITAAASSSSKTFTIGQQQQQQRSSWWTVLRGGNMRAIGAGRFGTIGGRGKFLISNQNNSPKSTWWHNNPFRHVVGTAAEIRNSSRQRGAKETAATATINTKSPRLVLENPGSKSIEDIVIELLQQQKVATRIPSANPSLTSLEETSVEELSELSYDQLTNMIENTTAPQEEEDDVTAAAVQQHLQAGYTDTMAHTLWTTVYGPNEIAPLPPPSWLALIVEQFEDHLVRILVGVAFVSAVLEYTSSSSSSSSGSSRLTESLWSRFAEPLVIATLLMVNAIVGVWQSKSATGSLAALTQLQPQTCTVIRNGGHEVSEYPSRDLIPGDIIVLKTGTKVPADARLLHYYKGRSTLRLDEAPLTGESLPVEKLVGTEGTTATDGSPPIIQDQVGMVYGGTTVVAGGGVAIVTATGTQTEFGKIQQGVMDAKQDAVKEKSPLTQQLDTFGNQLTVLIGLICGLVWLASIPKMLHGGQPNSVFASSLEAMIYYTKVAVALGVAAIPEGLPAVITLCLSLGTRRMAQRNVIVRNLPSVETLGCVSVICSDKTGTLTTNEMVVSSLIVFEKVEKTKKNRKQTQKTTTTKSAQTARASIPSSSWCVEYTVEGVSYSPVGNIIGLFDTTNPNPNHKENNMMIDSTSSIQDIVRVAALCNDARIIGNDDNTLDTKTKTGTADKNNINTKRQYERVGEPTEAALCVLAEKIIVGSNHKHNNNDNNSNTSSTTLPPSKLASTVVDKYRNELYTRMATLEFHRERKSMSVLVDNNSRRGVGSSLSSSSLTQQQQQHQQKRKRNAAAQNDLLVKGAANNVVDRCTHVKYRDGTVVKITTSMKREIESKITDMAKRPLRCLALAIKSTTKLPSSLRHFMPESDNDIRHHPLLKDPSTYEDIESGLTLVGLVGIKDPARPEVADSIRKCTDAGIRVMMITGDARDTAVAIARDVNIFDKDADIDTLKAYEGQEFFLKSHEEQLSILKKDNIVFCRAQPSDKQKLIKMLQHELNEIPAMTGDGVNDAPALQQAAIGVAMGTGTEVSKEASDMVLIDDNFSSIVSAVEEGRTIYANMQAFICFLISCNIGEICAIFFATILGLPEPLTAMHLLWVNLVTDGPPATALGFNPPSPNSMREPPRPSNEPIMTKWLLVRYMITGLYVGIATIGVYVHHYLKQGISFRQLSNWSNCGISWIPPVSTAAADAVVAPALVCSGLFRDVGRILPQTLSLTTLVCMEMLKALSAVSVNDSLLKVGPWKNKWLLVGVSGPFLLHLLVLYSSNIPGLSGFGKAFGMVPLTSQEWKTVLLWSLPILLLDEILKFTGRRLLRQQGTAATKSHI